MASDITLPTDGALNWGDTLNSAISIVDTDALNALSNVASHTANSPPDPHGDRAFAQSLVTPITSGTNQANGYVKLDGTGHIPANLISGTSAGGLYTKVFDAVGLYGMTSGTSDTSTQFQNALTAAANAGGGIVYVGPGTYSLANYVVIGSNTWLLLSEGTILQRIQGAINPPYIISNIQFGTTNTPATNFKISGGKLDAVGFQNLSTACTPIFAIQASKIEIRDLWINNVYNNPAIELNGCSVARVDWIHFTGTGNNFSQPTVPAIRINSSETATTPVGLLNSLYNGSVCQTVKITDCDIGPLAGTTFGTYGSFCATDFSTVHKSNDIVITAISTKYPSLNNIPVAISQWQNWSIDNCIFADTANNSTGTPWTNLTLKSGFAVGTDISNSSYTPSYRIMPDGQLAIRGVVNTQTVSLPGVIATLPVAFGTNANNQPSTVAMQANGGHAGIITVDQNGNLLLNGNFGNNNNVYIDGLLRI